MMRGPSNTALKLPIRPVTALACARPAPQTGSQLKATLGGRSGDTWPRVIQTWGEDLNQKPAETLDAYVTAFESLDAVAVASFYHLPCMFIVPGGVALVSDSDAARGMASRLIEQARSQNYRRTEILDLDVQTLAEPLALLSGVFARYNANEEEIGRFAFVYTMRRDGTGWQIVVAIAHDVLSVQS